MLETMQKTTSLSEIRDFLRAEGCSVPPWSVSRRTVDSLFALIKYKRNDEFFWRELKTLTDRLEDRRFSHATLYNSDVLAGHSLNDLIDDLKRSLGRPEQKNRNLRDWTTGTISAAALAGFLFLGMATGCDDNDDSESATDSDSDSDSDSDTDTDTDTLCDSAVELSILGHDGQVYCDLIDIINEANIEGWEKTELLDCLPDLDAAYREQLLTQFQEMDDQEIAAYLSSMLEGSAPCATEEDTH